MRFLSCIPRRSDGEPLLDAGGAVPGCVFCGVSKEAGFDVVFEDDELVAFRDRWPRAKEHVLIIPRAHISTVRDLELSHIPLLASMAQLGSSLAPGAKQGFHIPPFSSVHHLHLHVLVPPYTLLGAVQYPVAWRHGRGGGVGKGWSWFITPEQAVGMLERGQRIGVGPSRA
ncbi:hypothetical protein Q5752_001245 [Cryptotrichosporon argae]